MADTLIKMKTGTIAKLEQKNGNNPVVPLDEGTVYFAVDTTNDIGKIVYDAPDGSGGVDRIVMSTQAEYSDYAGEAAKTTGITGIYPVKGTQIAATATWTGRISGINTLFDGLTIAYYLPYDGISGTSVTLNLTLDDGTTTGAIPVYWTNASRATTHYGAGSTIILTYWSAGSISVKGTATTEGRWLRTDYDSTNIYQLRHNSGSYTTTTATGRYMLFLAHPTSGTSLIPVTAVNDSTATTKTLTSAKFNPFGPILYYSYNSTTAIAANATLTGSSLYEQVAFDLRYSFNTGTTLTNNKDVYIKATPQTDGTAILDETEPITQILPTTVDGKIYIYLGHAYSTSAIELHPVHPIYYYKNGVLSLYTAEPNATTTSAGLMSASDKSKLDGITENAQNTTIFATAPINASASTGSVTLTHSTSGPNTTADTSKGDTSNQTPTWGETFKVTSGTVDKYGHTKSFAEHTVKIPNAVATTTSAGLMSAADKSSFEAGITIAGNALSIGDTITADTLRTSLGLNQAMRFIGHATVAITDNSTTDPQILNYNFGVNGANAQAGDVIIDNTTAYEYIWSTLGRWERLGPDGDYALSNHTHPNATTDVAGFMSAADKSTLEAIPGTNVVLTATVSGETLLITTGTIGSALS